MLTKLAFSCLALFLIGFAPLTFASQAVSIAPFDISVAYEQAAQYTITVYEPAEGGSVDILIWSPPNSPYTQEDINRVYVQSINGNVAMSFDPNDNTLLTGKVDTFTGSEGQMEIPILITISSGAPAGDYSVSVNSVLPTGGVNGFANVGLNVYDSGQPPAVHPEDEPESNPTPEQPQGSAQIVGINFSTDYDKSKKYHVGDSISIDWLTAKNFGDGAGTRTIELVVTKYDMGKAKTQTLQSHIVSLSPEETKSYPGVDYTFGEAGSYEFKWDEQIQTVTVAANDDPRDEPTGFLIGPNIIGTHMSVSGEDATWNVGETITIQSVRAENSGDASGTKKIPFKISSPGGKEQTLFSETFTLKPGESAWHKKDIKYKPSAPGWYQFEWDRVAFPFQILAESTDDPRDESDGIADIKGYIFVYLTPDILNPIPYVNEDLDFVLVAQNFGDASGSKTLDFKVTFLESKNPTKTIHTQKFTLKPGQKDSAVIPYTPAEPGRYLFEWGESSEIITISNTKKEDPRDASSDGISDIRGAGFGWNAYVDTSGKSYSGEEFRFKISAENYGDAFGSRIIPLTVTITNDGKSVTKILDTKYLVLWPQEQFNDIVIFHPDGPGEYVFDWDGYTTGFEIGKESDDPRDVAIPGQANISASGLAWKARLDPDNVAYNGEMFDFELAAENYGDAFGRKDIPFTVTITNDGKSKTETLRIKPVALEPGEIFTDSVSFQPKGPGAYVFDWDGYTAGFEIGKESDDPRDIPTQGQANIKAQSINILDDANPKNTRFTQWDPLRIEVGAINLGDVIGTRDIDLILERHYGDKLREKYRLDTIQFTLKPEEYLAKTVLFVPHEIGQYKLIWGDLIGEFRVHSELTSDDPRDSSKGTPDIRGLAFSYTSEHGTAPRFYPDEQIYFYVSAKNFGDATGTKKMNFVITDLDDGSTETLYTKTFTLKPDQQQDNDKTISFTPKKTGVYLLEWGDFREIITIKDKSDDPRDSTTGTPDIRGRWIAAVNHDSGMFDVAANAGNYGDEYGEKTLAIKMTSTVDGKLKTETVHTQTFSLGAGENKDTNLMFPIKSLGLHIFEFDSKISVVDVSGSAKSSIEGLNISVNENEKSDKTKSLTINLDTMNFGNDKETRTLDLKLIRTYQGQQYTKSIYQETFTLGPGEQDRDSIPYEISEPGLYVFVWDKSMEAITVGDAQTTSNDGAKKPQSGCLIATATYGTELAPQVQLLREVRDGVLYSTGSGTTFMAGFNEFYYAFSPAVADLERQSPLFKEVVKIAITPMLSTMSILNHANIDSEQEMLGYGVGVILLNIGMYLVAPAITIAKIHSKLNKRKAS